MRRSPLVDTQVIYCGDNIKVLLDQILGEANFVNEIIWRRQSSHNDAKQGPRHFGRVHDTILLYAKTKDYAFKHLYRPYDPEYVSARRPCMLFLLTMRSMYMVELFKIHPWLLLVIAAVGVFALKVFERVASYVTQAEQALPVSFWEAWDTTLIMRCLVTIAALVTALYLILHHGSDSEQQKWAYGAVGTVLGFWLNSEGRRRRDS